MRENAVKRLWQGDKAPRGGGGGRGGVACPGKPPGGGGGRGGPPCRYPPKGIRSYGPTRAVYYAGFDYFAHANDEVLCIPQIETVEALENLDGILGVPGIDAMYIGPMDLSISMGITPEMDGEAPEYVAARRRIVEGCRRHGVIAGVNSTARTAVKRIEEGVRLVLVTGDAGGPARGGAGGGRARRG